MSTRTPAVSGRFYPDDKNELIETIEKVADKEKESINFSLANNNIIGGILPHAGYMFSAYQAIHFFEIIKKANENYETIIILNPNHSGYGEPIAFDEHDEWQTPLGKVELDQELMKKLHYPRSSIAHQYEHSGEVMVPFLQYYMDYDFKIVPISFLAQNLVNARRVAKDIYEVSKDHPNKILIIASSDFSHFVSPEYGKKMDDFVVEDVLNLDAEKIYKDVKDMNISVCGYAPIMALVEYAKLVCEKPKVEILKRGHSGEVIPSNEVVDYVSMLFAK